MNMTLDNICLDRVTNCGYSTLSINALPKEESDKIVSSFNNYHFIRPSSETKKPYFGSEILSSILSSITNYFRK